MHLCPIAQFTKVLQYSNQRQIILWAALCRPQIPTDFNNWVFSLYTVKGENNDV